MPALLDELAPLYVGEPRLVLALAPTTLNPKAFNAVDITVDYGACDPRGASLPLELIITAPSPSGFVRRIFTRSAPSTIAYVPREGGNHLIRLAEIGHNRWWGHLVISVAGDIADPLKKI